jgi:hypothetical protein
MALLPCLWALAGVSFAQTGNYFLSHYLPPDKKIDPLCFAVAQDPRGIMYFANRSGVLEFDGKNWQLAATPFPIYTLAVSAKGIIFAGGLAGFGKVEVVNGTIAFRALHGTDPDAKGIRGSMAANDFVYWISEKHVFVYEISSKTVSKLSAEAGNKLKGIFQVGDRLLVSSQSGVLYQLSGKTFSRSQFNATQGDLLFSDNRATGALLGTSLPSLYRLSGDAVQPVRLRDQQFLEVNGLVGGAWVTDELVALATLRGGVIFVHPGTGETAEITNFYTGLPDNEIRAIFCDAQGAVWVTHEYGITRIMPLAPFRNFTHYPGLSGSVLCALSLNDNLYVGTSLGVFKLVKDPQYEEQVYFENRVRQEKSARPAPPTAAAATPAAAPVEPRTAAKSSLLGRRKAKPTTAASAQEPAPNQPPAAPVPVRERKTRKVLKSLQFSFARVKGIEGKISFLSHADGKIVAGGLAGLFSVSGLDARPISDVAASSLYVSASLNQLFVGTYDERIEAYRIKPNGWERVTMPDSLRDFFTHIFEDKLQNVWYCGRAGVVKLEYDENQLLNVEQLPFEHPTTDKTVGLAVGTDVYIVQGGKFYRYQSAESRFTSYDSLPDTRKYIASAGMFWFNDGKKWRTIDTQLSARLQLNWLDIFTDLRFLSLDQTGKAMWVVTAANRLFHFQPAEAFPPPPHPLSLKTAQGEEVKRAPGNRLVMQESGFLQFQFIQPEYWGNNTTQYRFWFEGLNKAWSPWTFNNTVPIPYLPAGNYAIRVESRDLFGKISQMEEIKVQVLPPYWKTPWFYALELAFFLTLVMLSVWLSVRNPRYRPVSQVLSMLTVILFIQLVQTSIYAYVNVRSSPVIEFFIQVVIALLVLPVEQRLRRFMEMATDGQYQISKLFLPAKKEDD